MNKQKIESLAVAVASGRRIKDWCKQNEVPLSSAYRWSRTEKFRARVNVLRHRMTDRVLGRLTDNGVAAVEEIRRIMGQGTGDVVRLNAARAILSEIVTFSGFASLDARITELEHRTMERTDGRKEND